MTEPEWRSGVDRRLERIETTVSQLQVNSAVMAASAENMSTKLDDLSTDQKELKKAILWPARAMMLGFLAAFVTFVINGGLAP